jgi:hypothetical protein
MFDTDYFRWTPLKLALASVKLAVRRHNTVILSENGKWYQSMDPTLEKNEFKEIQSFMYKAICEGPLRLLNPESVATDMKYRKKMTEMGNDIFTITFCLETNTHASI